MVEFCRLICEVTKSFCVFVSTSSGSYLGYRTVHNYDSMVEVIRGLSDTEKAELVRKVQELVGSTSIEALITFIGQQVNREIFVNLVREFANQANKSGG